MKTVRLSRKDFEKRFPGAGAGTERFKGEEPVVYLPGRASTKERLHEIYHATLSPELELIGKGKEWHNSDEKALEELRAEDFAASSTGRDYMSRESILGVCCSMLDDGDNPAVVMGSITRALKELGYEPLTQGERSAFWEWMRNYKKDTEEVEDSG